MSWRNYILDYKTYLKLERNLSENTIQSYLSDIEIFKNYCEKNELSSPEKITLKDIKEFIQQTVKEEEISSRTQARYLSALKSFFGYLKLENRRGDNPTELLESPKIGMKLPNTLSKDEIEAIIGEIDLSSKFGHRNKAIIEIMYGCGLRVSEVITLKFSDLFFKDYFIRVIGKGNKQRLVPILQSTITFIEQYSLHYRRQQEPQHGYEDCLFLNNRGKTLSRNMVFMMIQKLTKKAGIQKKISPHTFRHSFATQLLHNGADIRSIQMMLGHESITTTEIYTHIEQKQLQETILNYHPRNV